MMYLRKCRINLSPAVSPSPLPEPTEALANLDLSVYAGLDPNKPFSPAALRAHMDSWILVLAKHLNAEIDTLKPEYFERIGEKKMKDVDAEATKLMEIYDPAWFLCSAVGRSKTGSTRRALMIGNSVDRARASEDYDSTALFCQLFTCAGTYSLVLVGL